MRALVLEKFGEMIVAHRPTPDAGPGEVVVRVVATGICGSDLHGYTGENGRRVPGQVMGHETVGTIAALGEGVDGLDLEATVTFNPLVVSEADAVEYEGREQHAPGKMVIGVKADVSAAFAEYVVVPARNIVTLPSGMPVSYGALIEPIAVALHAARRVRVRAGDKVFVIGGGPIGQSAVLAVKAEGVTDIVVSEVDPARRALLEKLGATTIDPVSSPASDQIRSIFGSLADVTLDAVGISRTLADALTSTAFGGQVCLVGMGAPTLDIDAYRVSTEERTIVGSFCYSHQDFRDAAAFVASAPPELAELISREVSLDDAPAAFAALAAHDGTAGKVLVRFDSDFDRKA